MFTLVGESARKGYREDVTFQRGSKGFAEFYGVSRKGDVAGRGRPEAGQGGGPAHRMFGVHRACGPGPACPAVLEPQRSGTRTRKERPGCLAGVSSGSTC